MLPIDPNKTLDYIDEKDGTKLGFCYLLGRKQTEYIELLEMLQENIRSCNRLLKYSNSRKDEELEVDEYFIKENTRLQVNLNETRRDLVDLFLVKVNDKMLDCVPSTIFLPNDIEAIAEIIQERLPELAGNNVESTVKNSHRPHSSLSKQTPVSTSAKTARRKHK